MKNDPIDHTLNIIYNIKADILLGVRLRKHFIDISMCLLNVHLSIRNGRMNNEETKAKENLWNELFKLKVEIVEQLKNPD